MLLLMYLPKYGMSLSARRAWIEITGSAWVPEFPQLVALRKESVDRNMLLLVLISLKIGSLSARRAWIEITQRRDFKRLGLVALRKESVDRNTQRRDFKRLGLRRSPQGERG